MGNTRACLIHEAELRVKDTPPVMPPAFAERDTGSVIIAAGEYIRAIVPGGKVAVGEL